MPSYPLRALVLRKTKLGETDTILTLLAADGGQVRAVAKGLRKPGGRFGARLEPYAVCDLLLHTGRSLEVVTEAQTVASHSGLREDLDRSAAAAVVADLLDKTAVEGQPEPRLFALATTTLDVMESAPIDSLAPLVIAFLLKAMAMHGYRPQLESCACCAGEMRESSEFSVAHGGAVCPECGSLDAATLRFGAEGRAWLETLLGARLVDVAELNMPPAAVVDCFELVRAFVTFHTPARLRALDYYAGVLPRA
jgi:DNA repair protein RecO (recombination protein O)